MLTIVLVSLSVALLAVISVLLAAFFDVAFREPQRAVVRTGVKGNWQPPLASSLHEEQQVSKSSALF